MKTELFPRAISIAIAGALALSLAGCGKALIYAEGTNFSLTTLRLNEDPATPVRMVSGLDRTVAAVVPRRAADGDAVNMSANFHLEHKKDGKTFPSVFGDTLKITTEFASGAAAYVGPTTAVGDKKVEPTAAGAGEVVTSPRASPLAEEILKGR